MSYVHDIHVPLAASIEEAQALLSPKSRSAKSKWVKEWFTYCNHKDASVLLVPTAWVEDGGISIVRAERLAEDAVIYTDRRGNSGVLAWFEFASAHESTLAAARKAAREKMLHRTPEGRAKLAKAHDREIAAAKRVLASGKVRIADVRLLTGWCALGARAWADRNGFEGRDSAPLAEVMEVAKREAANGDSYAAELLRLLEEQK